MRLWSSWRAQTSAGMPTGSPGAELVEVAVDRGVAPTQLVVDPGHDMGKTTMQSLALLHHLDDLAALGHPVLVALSNKDFAGESVGAGPEERGAASPAAPGRARPERARARDLKLMAFHPLGTARADARPAHGVVDGDLQLHGVRGVHVAYGTVVPNSLGVNPQLTNSALAIGTGAHASRRSASSIAGR